MTTYVRNYASADVLIIGGGGAGLRAAIEAREQGADVLIVSRSRVGYGSNTAISGGGFAAVTATSREIGDTPEQHLADTIRGGYYVNDQDLVEVMTRSAEQQVGDLQRFGVGYASAEGSPWTPATPTPDSSMGRTPSAPISPSHCASMPWPMASDS
jgi:succinate dehydrogenase/fumarate reductase flavoprotein subunit